VHLNKTIQQLYEALLGQHKLRGWWPLLSLGGRKGFDERGYHPGEYGYPQTEEQRLEVILGAILTQNTAWTNAEKALLVLLEKGLLNQEVLRRCEVNEVAQLIRPSGYYKQKARKIKAVLDFLKSRRKITRDHLLCVWGVGPETADSILLYAYHQPFFVVDAYTKRLLAHLGILGEGARYDQVQRVFHEALPLDATLFNEYHALVVEHGKRYYSKKPYGEDDPLVALLSRGQRSAVRERAPPRG
jgi:endonuclease-3 related protein